MPTTIITGASSGLGAEMAPTARRSRGWDLALCGAAHRPARRVSVTRSSSGPPRAGGWRLRALDVTDDDAVFEVFGVRSARTSATIDRVIINAGLGQGGTDRHRPLSTPTARRRWSNFVAALAQTRGSDGDLP